MIEDEARAVREGEELPEGALREYLSTRLEAISSDEPLRIKQFPGGHSNLTYLLTQGDTELILRRPPVGSKVKAAHDMGREFRVLSKLGPAYDKAPTPELYCENEEVIGSNFYIMERVRGFILRKKFPDEIEATPELLSGLCESLVKTMSEVHAVDYQEIGLGELGRPEGYVQRQVEGWNKRYQQAKTDEIAAVDFLAGWLADHMPPENRPALIHNDFKFDNLVLSPTKLTQVIGILDWEMSTLGDPLMDLGTALSYWVDADDPDSTHMLRFGPTHLPGMFTRQQVASHYQRITGCSLDHILFYYAFGLFKSLGVVQQIYYRFHKGLTKDPRFGQFIHAVRILSDQATLAIERNHI